MFVTLGGKNGINEPPRLPREARPGDTEERKSPGFWVMSQIPRAGDEVQKGLKGRRRHVFMRARAISAPNGFWSGLGAMCLHGVCMGSACTCTSPMQARGIAPADGPLMKITELLDRPLLDRLVMALGSRAAVT